MLDRHEPIRAHTAQHPLFGRLDLRPALTQLPQPALYLQYHVLVFGRQTVDVVQRLGHAVTQSNQADQTKNGRLDRLARRLSLIRRPRNALDCRNGRHQPVHVARLTPAKECRPGGIQGCLDGAKSGFIAVLQRPANLRPQGRLPPQRRLSRV